MTRPVVGIAGLTHLGLVSAAAAAERGVPVIGFDTEPGLVDAVRRGALPVVEPELPELLRKNCGRISWTASAPELAACDVAYVAPDVPTDETGASDLGPVRRLIGVVNAAIRADAPLVVLSQVPPGFTRRLPRPTPRLFYQVETLVIGQAVERALYPERFILGCADPRAQLPKPLAAFLGAFGCPILSMRYESAELAKIAVNMCLAASISTANTLAELCERLGADWAEIVPALKLDKRIGPHAYLTPGLGIGGGHLERDLATVCSLADAHGTDAGVVRAWISNSAHRRDWTLTQVHERVIAQNPEPTFAVWGLAYKPGTASTKNSPSLALLAALAPFAVRVYDPVVTPLPAFHPRLVPAASALDACAGADALVIMTPWSEFGELVPPAIAARLRGRTVVDPYAVLEGEVCRAAGLDHVTLGSSPPEPARGAPHGPPSAHVDASSRQG